MQQRTHPNTKRQPSRAGNIHLAYADAPSGVVLTFFFDGAMVAKLYWLGDISFSAIAPVNMSVPEDDEGVSSFYVYVGIHNNLVTCY